MKKTTKLLWCLFTFCLLFSFAAVASADEGEKLTITETDLVNGDKDISALDMKGSSTVKTIWIEDGAITRAANQNKSFVIDMDDVKVSIPASALMTEEFKTAQTSREPVEVKLELDIDSAIDLSQYFNAYTQSQKDNYSFYSYGIDIETHVLVAGQETYTVKQFASPITITYHYASAWQSGVPNVTEKNITLGWYDIDSEISKSKEWVRQNTKVNTADKTFTSTVSYACGFYLPMACKDLDNTGSGNNGSGTSNNSGVNVPAGGIPAGHWATADIELMQQAGIVPSDLSSVQVNQPITRGEFAAYVVKTLKLEENTSLAGKFTDVPASHPYYKEIMTGAYYGIINGVSDTAFQPSANITRQEMAALFTRALNQKQVETSADLTKLSQMKDAGQVAAWAKESCAVAVNAGLITGTENGAGQTVFAPKNNTTWAEAVVMLHRLYEMVK